MSRRGRCRTRSTPHRRAGGVSTPRVAYEDPEVLAYAVEQLVVAELALDALPIDAHVEDVPRMSVDRDRFAHLEVLDDETDVLWEMTYYIFMGA